MSANMRSVGEFLRFVQCSWHFVSYKVSVLVSGDNFGRQSRHVFRGASKKTGLPARGAKHSSQGAGSA
jgi:hypothetical protein